MAHVSLLCIEYDVPWSFLLGPQSVLPSSVPLSSHDSSKEHPLFVDTSASTYAMFPSVSFPLPLVFGLGEGPHCIPDPESDPLRMPTLSIRPLSTTVLIHLSEKASSSVQMIRLHFLHAFKSPRSSLSISDSQTHMDITRNYHQLALLSDIRWRLGYETQLPFHLAAVHTMRTILETADYGGDS